MRSRTLTGIAVIATGCLVVAGCGSKGSANSSGSASSGTLVIGASVSLTGVLASVIDPLAQSGIPIFAISTFDTDYVLVKEEFAESALKTLQAAGHELIS